MVNKRFLDLAKRQMNPSLPKERKEPITQDPTISNESFIFSYDGPHEDFFQELIAKSNEKFKGTEAEIPAGTSGEIQGHLIKRLGLITTIYNNPQLKSANLYPITPAQSEYLLKEGKLTNFRRSNWEDLGIVLYDKSPRGHNPKEAQALYESLKKHRQDLGLSQSDLENKLIIINAGAEVDSDMRHGVKPIIIPEITQVYQHEVLGKVGKNLNFNGYGLNGGLPLLSQLGSGNRTLGIPGEISDIGLRVLYCSSDFHLYARGEEFASDGGGINFVYNKPL